jgi:succinoglycan biosynthesis protein ExoA
MSTPASDPAPVPELREAPAVTVVMPVLNEERHLAEAVGAVLAQEYAGEIAVVLALGPSSDATDQVAARLAADPRVRTVPNPSGRTPEALNRALALAEGDVVVRVDGHAVLPPGYVSRAVRALREHHADNVGGVMAAEGVTPVERAVACAMTSPLGVGGAPFHVGGTAGPADTVYLGVFRRSALDRVGGYDERFTRAQDWEMNHRIRATGGLVWFEPELQVSYRPRATLRALARQYRDYGRWRRAVVRRHPGTLTARYLAPPVALSAVVVGTVAGVVGATTGPSWLLLGLLAPGGYAVGVVGGAVVTGRGLALRERALLPAVFATMHGSWGWGFLTSPRTLLPPDEASEGSA